MNRKKISGNFNCFGIAVVLFVFTLPCFSQTGTINGTVKSDNGDPMTGVSVTSGRLGTTTNADGFYTLTVSAGKITVNYSYAGYVTQSKTVEVPVGGSITVDITLAERDALEQVIVTGTRANNRVATSTPVPVDVLSVSDLGRAVPQSNLNQLLNYVAPSFTSNTMTVADGTDHIDPAQLRGLGPDQVLVLLNGKRRHTTSLVNVNGSPGRGSVGTDLNAIPAFAIDRIEVLRDGAAAQYGSDAIAGVINVLMKKATGKLDVQILGGGFVSSGANDHRGGLDGGQLQLDLNYGFGVGKKGGFINLTGSGIVRDDTRRATDFNSTIYNGYNAVEYRAALAGVNITGMFSNINSASNINEILTAIKRYAPQVSYFDAAKQSAIQSASSLSAMQTALNFDVTDNELAARGLERRDFNMRIGQSKLKSGQFFANAEFPVNDHLKIYSFGGYGYRAGNSAGFYRRPNQARAYTGLYLDGFLPEITSDITDKSLAAGVKGKLGENWAFDFSNTIGNNQFKYGVENTSNTSLGMNSPTQFYAGTLGFTQNTTNLDIARAFDALEGINLAFGGEFRFEEYKIKAGDVNSYATYDINGNVATPTTVAANLPTDFFGAARPGGAQVFPGFQKDIVGTRRSQAAYLDLEFNFSKKFLVNVATRFENYSDFGSTFTYKLATRYTVAPGFNLRGAFSTGFRAPSLQQKYFSSTATQFVGGVPFEVGFFPNGSPVPTALGIPNLKQEDSKSVSAGFTYKVPNTNLTFTVDGYFVHIDNRVILTGLFAKPAPSSDPAKEALRLKFEEVNANSGTFFTNAINTESKGIDYIVSNRFNLGNGMMLKTDLAGTVSVTKRVGPIKASSLLENAGLLNTYFGESDRVYLEQAIPRAKVSFMNTLTIRNLELFFRQTYFGKVTDPNTADVNGDGIVQGAMINGQFIAVEHPVWGARTITDFSAGYNFNKHWRVTIGANNIFDIYPDRNLKTQTARLPLAGGGYAATASTIDLSNQNQFEYSRNVSQFGMNGRYVFIRLGLTL